MLAVASNGNLLCVTGVCTKNTETIFIWM